MLFLQNIMNKAITDYSPFMLPLAVDTLDKIDSDNLLPASSWISMLPWIGRNFNGFFDFCIFIGGYLFSSQNQQKISVTILKRWVLASSQAKIGLLGRCFNPIPLNSESIVIKSKYLSTSKLGFYNISRMHCNYILHVQMSE